MAVPPIDTAEYPPAAVAVFPLALKIRGQAHYTINTIYASTLSYAKTASNRL